MCIRDSYASSCIKLCIRLIITISQRLSQKLYICFVSFTIGVLLSNSVLPFVYTQNCLADECLKLLCKMDFFIKNLFFVFMCSYKRNKMNVWVNVCSQ